MPSPVEPQTINHEVSDSLCHFTRLTNDTSSRLLFSHGVIIATRDPLNMFFSKFYRLPTLTYVALIAKLVYAPIYGKEVNYMDLSPKDALKQWYAFQDSNVVETFKQYRQFIDAFAGKLPIDSIRKRAEEAAYQSTDSQSKVIEYFEYNQVLTAKGLIAYVRALAALKRHNLIRKTINKYWLSLKFSKSELEELLEVAEEFLQPEDYVKKIDSLLEQEEHSEIPLFLKYVDADTKKLTKLRQDLQKADDVSDKKVKDAKRIYKNSSGLLFDLVKWHRKKYETEEAIRLL